MLVLMEIFFSKVLINSNTQNNKQYSISVMQMYKGVNILKKLYNAT